MKKSTVMPSFGFSTGLRYCLLRSATALAQSASFNSTLGTGSYRNEALPFGIDLPVSLGYCGRHDVYVLESLLNQ